MKANLVTFCGNLNIVFSLIDRIILSKCHNSLSICVYTKLYSHNHHPLYRAFLHHPPIMPHWNNFKLNDTQIVINFIMNFWWAFSLHPHLSCCLLDSVFGRGSCKAKDPLHLSLSFYLQQLNCAPLYFRSFLLWSIFHLKHKHISYAAAVSLGDIKQRFKLLTIIRRRRLLEITRPLRCPKKKQMRSFHKSLMKWNNARRITTQTFHLLLLYNCMSLGVVVVNWVGGVEYAKLKDLRKSLWH